MSVHYMQGLSAQHLVGVSMVSLVGIPIGAHSPHSARLGHPSRLKIGTLAPLPAFNCSEEVFAMHILAESRLTFRQGHTVQPFAMVSGKQVCRYQDMSKESQTRGHSVRIVWQIEAQKKCAFVSVVSVQAKPRQKGQQCRSHYGGKAGKLVDRVVQVSNLELAQN